MQLNQNNNIAAFTFASRYAKFLPEKRRRETYEESCDRFTDMLFTKYSDCPEVFSLISEINGAMKKKELLPSMRGLQWAGSPVFQHNAKIYNCSGSYCDRPRFFQEAMYLLLCGTGVGFSVQTHHVDKLPGFAQRKNQEKVYVIPDSVEGWSDAIGVLISSYLENSVFPEYTGYDVVFDYTQIRPQGSPFSHGIGVAPGPNGLRRSLEKIQSLLQSRYRDGYKKLRPIDCYDIMCFAADAVLSGGIRRSALICLFSFHDEEMMAAKIGNFYIENPQRARANNSAVLLRNNVTREEFEKMKAYTKVYGEPGSLWVDTLEHLANPCVEQSFYAYDSKGNSGWQMCNLSTHNCSKITSEDHFYELCRLNAAVGTLQGGFNKFPYLGEASEEIIQREALIGPSMTAIMTKPEITLNPEILRKGAEIVKETNRQIAKIIGINQAARSTCIKPEGSSTTILGLGSFAGCHMGKGKWLIRHVQCNRDDPILQHYKKINPEAVVESVWSQNKTDDSVRFVIESPNGALLERDHTAIQFLENVKTLQQNWVMPGKNTDLCVNKDVCNNVSNTCLVQDHEWDEVWDYVYDNREFFTGISFISAYGDKDYAQAPFCEIFTLEQVFEKYGEVAGLVEGLIEQSHELFGGLWEAWQEVFYPSGLEVNEARVNWISGVKSLADTYLAGDLKKMSYLMKDVFNHNLAINIINNHTDFVVTDIVEDQNNTNPIGEIACGGGACIV